MTLVGRQQGKGTIRSGSELEHTLNLIVLHQGRPKNLSKLAGRVPPECVHLEEAVLRRDIPLARR